MQAVMRVKPWGQGQGDFVEINVEDFNPDFHQPLDAAEKPAGTGDPAVTPPKALTVAELRAALEAKGVEIPDGAKKAELQALLDAAEKPAE